MIRRSPLKSKTPLRSKSTPKFKRHAKSATKDESKRIGDIKQGWCVCCYMNREFGIATANFGGCDAHHLLSGGRRVGHAATVALCPWHHRGIVPFDAMTQKQATDMFGPSWELGSKPFRAVYGSDDELMRIQEMIKDMDMFQ